MSYLGPKSFSTAPLTSSNLAFLNDLSSSELHPSKNNASLHDSRKDNNFITDSNKTMDDESQNKPPTGTQPTSPSLLESEANKEESETINDKTHASTDSSSNSLSAFSTISTTNTPKSSETSIHSLGESHSHRTLIDLNEEDNKTVILTSTNNTVSNNSPNANESQLIIPSCPMKTYDLVSVSTSTDSVNDYNNNIHNSNALFDVESISNPSRFPLLRKKSGELVKSSLKLNSLQRSNSMPNAKSVRFASRLENVKFFKKSERPTAVSSRFAAPPRTHWEFDSNSSSDNDDSGFRHDDDGEDDAENGFKLNESYEDFLSDDEIDSASRWIITSNDCPYNPVSLNFAKLGSNNNVILESVKLNSSGNSLIGFVYVKNIAFTKKIVVKLTYDNWNSFIEIENANYISSNHIFKYSDSIANNYDKFSFIIKLDNLNTFGNNLTLIFCVQYLANSISFWDNNNGSNYKIVLRKANSIQSGDNIGVDNSIKNKKMIGRKNFSNLLDIEDSNIKLKDNNNFMNSSSCKPLTTDMSSLRISNSFGLKKIRSESSIPSMKSNILSEFNNKSTSSLSNSKSEDPAPVAIKQTKVQFSKSANASPALNSPAFYPSPKEFNDYDHIVKQFCFFSTSDQKKSGGGVGTGLCATNSINEQNYLDGFNHSKSQASLPVDL
ncbi:hypothetical protein PICMEDRAFT_73335 [Pichia membranifaciens NRRL Y-2026]|uniref:CBM21 domain-containing protein n=1 Tax=Pichia membranifaciens NRRL Y-2026 TaxID=763406 RepID=A0A1E3NI95_9ASCO|nr:hypothetical protein PICMEDRAFT_73335 [Pichia membranifaciens NRRL Y-2026]ODQ45841.1 hypothetical protein PICMEDRAFT_73335 [Pichia membranifaciens NRRL Y-2026]